METEVRKRKYGNGNTAWLTNVPCRQRVTVSKRCESQVLIHRTPASRLAWHSVCSLLLECHYVPRSRHVPPSILTLWWQVSWTVRLIITSFVVWNLNYVSLGFDPLKQLWLLQYSKLQMAKTVVNISVVRVYNTYSPCDSLSMHGQIQSWSKGWEWYTGQQYDIVMNLTMPLLCIVLNSSVSKLPSLPLYS